MRGCCWASLHSFLAYHRVSTLLFWLNFLSIPDPPMLSVISMFFQSVVFYQFSYFFYIVTYENIARLDFILFLLTTENLLFCFISISCLFLIFPCLLFFTFFIGLRKVMLLGLTLIMPFFFFLPERIYRLVLPHFSLFPWFLLYLILYQFSFFFCIAKYGDVAGIVFTLASLASEYLPLCFTSNFPSFLFLLCFPDTSFHFFLFSAT